MKNGFRRLKKDNQGIGIVEIILILVVLIALVILFKDKITGIVDSILGKIGVGSQEIGDVIPTITP